MLRRERLSFSSSVLLCPWFVIPDDCVEDSEEFSGDGNGDRHLWFASIEEALTKDFEIGIVFCGNEGSDEENGPTDGPSATDEAFATPFAGLAGPWCKACKGGNLAAVEAAEFRHLGHERAGNHRSDAEDRTEQVFLFLPQGGFGPVAQPARKGMQLSKTLERNDFRRNHIRH